MMRRSLLFGVSAATAILALAFFGPVGCSTDEGTMVAPDAGMPSSGGVDYAPDPPVGLSVALANAYGAKVVWEASTEPDLAGYRVYLYDPSPYRDDAFVCLTGNDVLPNNWYRFVPPGPGPHYLKVTAVDEAGNESYREGPIEVTLPAADSGPGADKAPATGEQDSDMPSTRGSGPRFPDGGGPSHDNPADQDRGNW